MTSTTTRWNEKFSDLMDKLADIMSKQGETFRARAYQKAQETIMAFNGTITSPDDLKNHTGIGETIMEKLKEFVNTGTLKIIEREKNNPINILTDVYGIGPKKAKELVEKGINTIELLRENKDLLNDIQLVGLEHYEDVLKRIPRSEIDEYNKIFTNTFNPLVTSSNDKYEIVGSYRRGASDSGDIDIIITSNKSDIFKKFIDNLIKDKIITNVLSRGPTKCLVITKLPGENQTSRRVDFLYTNQEEYPFSVLYFTGSKYFNTVMRHHALGLDYTMNEHGLYKIIGGKKGDKVEHKFSTEKDIFDFLNLVFKEPIERKDGRAVIVKGSKEELETQETQEIPEKKEEEKEEEIIVKKVIKTKKNKSLKNKKKIIDTASKMAKDDLNDLIIDNKIKHIMKIETLTIDEINETITNFKSLGISVLNNLHEDDIITVLEYANDKYRNMEPVMTDNEYDIIYDYVVEKYPNNYFIKKIGAPVEKNKVKLPYEMWSMDKIKPDTNALENWCVKFNGPYVLSCKLDGVSGMYTTEGKEAKLYTRGDGKVGQDVSYLIPYLKLPKDKNIVIRGEFIMKKTVFEEKYKNDFANPRNLVSGIVNRISIDEKISDIDFVAYEVIKPEMIPSKQLEYLTSLTTISVVANQVCEKISNEVLSNNLLNWRTNYEYEIDGVIVTDDKIYERKSGGNPEHAFAFKMLLSDQIAEAKVVDVIWSPSKDGYLKPRVQIEPINLGGVKIEFATGFNGAFIENNKIGIGALIKIVRSGDVIPYIMGVTVPAQQAKMPTIEYKWNETHIDILLENVESDSTVREKIITAFFKGIGVEGLSSGNIARIIEMGYDSVDKIIKMTKTDFLTIPGFKDKMATKLYEGIESKLKESSLLTLMTASNILGRGLSEKKLEPIMEMYPNILTSNETIEKKIQMVTNVKGMARKSAELFVNNISKFIEFMKLCGLENKLVVNVNEQKNKIIDESHPLYKKTIVMTGFRDENIKNKLTEIGAIIGSSVSKNTFIVLSKYPDDKTGKILDAEKLGVKIMTPDEFLAQYLHN